METLKMKLEGISSLIMHNGILANPLAKPAKVISPLAKKRNKTEADLYYLARLEWEGGLYTENGIVVLPIEVLYKATLMGARKTRTGPLFESGAQVVSAVPLKYDGTRIEFTPTDIFPNPELDKFFEEHVYITMVNVQKRKILRARPIFHNWSCEVSYVYNPDFISKDTLISAVENCGHFVGFCDHRPQYGRFSAQFLV